MKLSAVLIAKNEQDTIGRCLDSLKGVDEIIVLDTGSTDRTEEVCHRYPRVKVFYSSWNDDFAEARNKALDYCTGDWIISIDCDEVLESTTDDVRQAISNNRGVSAIAVTHRNDHADFTAPRILKREGLYWSRPIHETPSHRVYHVEPGIIIRHYHNGVSADHNDRNIRILRSLLAQKHMDTDAMFYLGEELHNRGDYDASVYWLSTYVEMAPKHRAYTSWAYYLMSNCYWELFRRQKAEDCLMRAVSVNPEFRRAYLRLYDVTKNEKWLQMADRATNKDVLVIEHDND